MASKGSGICVVAFDNQEKVAAAVRSATIESVKSFRELSSLTSFLQRTKKSIVIITIIDEKNALELFESTDSVEAVFILSLITRDLNTYPSKVIGVYLQAESLLRALPETLETIETQLNARSLLINHQLDRQDNPDFYFYDIWKNETNEKKHLKTSFIIQARHLFQSNDQIQFLIDDFENLYRRNQVLLWLNTSRYAFPYHLLLSHALRTHDEATLSSARFFFKHLERYLRPLPSGQVYLGTKLPMKHVRRLENHRKEDAVAFQCFLPLTQSRANAFSDATKSSRRENLLNVLFKMEMNGALGLPIGDQFLLDMGTPFHIQYITRTMGANGKQEELVIIKLIALSGNEREKLLEQFLIRQGRSKRKTPTTTRILTARVKTDEDRADEHITRREWTEASILLSRIFNPSVRVLNKLGWLSLEHFNDLDGALHYHEQALTKSINEEQAESELYLAKVYQKLQRNDEALAMYTQAFEWLNTQKQPDWVKIARCLVGMSTTQRAMGRLENALDCAEQALAIREHRIEPRDDFGIAACLGNMGNILHDQGDIDRALSCALQALNLLNTCQKGDPRLAAALNNLGALYQSADENEKAREYFQRALQSLPDEKHPHHESTLANINQLNLHEQSTE